MPRGSGLWAEPRVPPVKGLLSVPRGPGSRVCCLGQRGAEQRLN